MIWEDLIIGKYRLRRYFPSRSHSHRSLPEELLLVLQVFSYVIAHRKILEIRGPVIVVIEVDVMDLHSSSLWPLTKLLRD